MKNFKFSVITLIFGSSPIDKVISTLANIGYDAVDIYEPDRYDPKEIYRLARDNGIYVNSIAGFTPGLKPGNLRALCHPDKKERLIAIDFLKSLIDFGAAVVAKNIMVVPSLVSNPAYFVSREEDTKRSIESISIAGSYAEKTDLMIVIEPINRYEVGIVNSIEEALMMAEVINNPAVRIMGDTYHMNMEEKEGVPNTIRKAGGYWFQHLHAVDNTREVPGKGTLPWKEILHALYDINYQGIISLEPFPKLFSPYETMKETNLVEKLAPDLKLGLEYLQMVNKLVHSTN